MMPLTTVRNDLEVPLIGGRLKEEAPELTVL